MSKNNKEEKDLSTSVEKVNTALTNQERKALIRKASKAINTQYKEAFQRISKN